MTSMTSEYSSAPNAPIPKSRDVCFMSALPPKADMCSALAHICFGPIADIVAASKLFASAWSTGRTREKQQFTGDCSDLRSPLCLWRQRRSALLDDLHEISGCGI
jgi:hypothetical protein